VSTSHAPDDKPAAADAHVTLHTEPGTIENELHDPLEEQLTSALRAAVDRLAGTVTGQPVDQVYDELVRATGDGLHPDIAAHFEPDEAELRRVATLLARGEVPG
jgi:hypothetical protein